MTFALYCAALLAFFLVATHSYLGEKRIISPLLSRSDDAGKPIVEGFSAALLRGAWHLTSWLFLGFGLILLLAAMEQLTQSNVLIVIGGLFLPFGLYALIPSKGRHVAWAPSLAIAAISLVAALR